MARFSIAKEFEVKEAVESPTIAHLRELADAGQVDAFSLKLRHPRFTTRFTQPHFYVRFKLGGTTYVEDAESLEILNAVIVRDYLAVPA